jgi:mRNA interferase RelE/StbE
VPASSDRSESRPGKTWRIEITRTAEKQITKLSRTAQKSIQRFLRERLLSAENPRQWGKPLHGEKRSLWRYRVGDYRLICDIQDEKLVALVLEVSHRKDVYR